MKLIHRRCVALVGISLLSLMTGCTEAVRDGVTSGLTEAISSVVVTLITTPVVDALGV